MSKEELPKEDDGLYHLGEGSSANWWRAQAVAKSLYDAASNSDTLGERKLAARWLYYLGRYATLAIRELYETEPELFEGLASLNSIAPWCIREGDKPSTEKEWLKTIGLASELLPETRKFAKIETTEIETTGIETTGILNEFYKRNVTKAYSLALKARESTPPDVTPDGKSSRPTMWPNPSTGTLEPVPKGGDFQQIVKALGWKEAARFLPIPNKNKATAEFKAWLSVVRKVYRGLPIRDQILHYTKNYLEEFEKDHWTPEQYEKDKIVEGLAAAIQRRKSFSN
jgi:hypothetical protein